MGKNKKLIRAQKDKQDEFYTAYNDIEVEMPFYEQHFINKTVYCNCDDSTQSNYFKYFVNNFHRLQLKRLLASCYKPNPASLFETEPAVKAHMAEYTGKLDTGGVPVICRQELQGNGDFRSRESVNLLKQSDIVVTNPPFSLFRAFVVQLARHNKNFLILGNMNSICRKHIFELFMKGKIGFGRNARSNNLEFRVSDKYVLRSPTQRMDENGDRYIMVNGIRWFTNLEYENHRKFIELTATYQPEKYPKYDNYDAINVDHTLEIPSDYDDVMGVPISFLDKYNPGQFEILGANKPTWGSPYRGDTLCLNGKALYSRILIRKKQK